MRNPNNAFGLLLIVVGGFILLNNFNLLHINIHEVMKFWPLLLVYAGLVLLSGKNNGWVVSLSMVAITVIFIIIYYIFKNLEVYKDNFFPIG